MTEDVFLDCDMRNGSEVLLVAERPHIFESVPSPTRPAARPIMTKSQSGQLWAARITAPPDIKLAYAARICEWSRLTQLRICGYVAIHRYGNYYYQ